MGFVCPVHGPHRCRRQVSVVGDFGLAIRSVVVNSGLISFSISFLLIEVAISGYSIVFIMVVLRQYHASLGLIRFVRMESQNFVIFPFRYRSSSFMFPLGLVCIPRASSACVTLWRWTLYAPFCRYRSPGVSWMHWYLHFLFFQTTSRRYQ
jgi:hypothetical protein